MRIRKLIYISVLFCSFVTKAGIFDFGYDKAIYQAQRGNFKDAQDAIKKLIVDNPNAPDMLYDSGVISFENKQFEQAAAYFKDAAENKNASHKLKEQAFFNLGNTHVELKKLKEAIKSYEDVLKINPDNQDAKRNLEIVKKMLQQQEQQQQKDQQKQDQDQKQKDKQEKDKREQQDKQKQHQQQKDQQQKQKDQQKQEEKEKDQKKQKQGQEQKSEGEKKQEDQPQQQKEQQKQKEQKARDKQESEDKKKEQDKPGEDQKNKREAPKDELDEKKDTQKQEKRDDHDKIPEDRKQKSDTQDKHDKDDKMKKEKDQELEKDAQDQDDREEQRKQEQKAAGRPSQRKDIDKKTMKILRAIEKNDENINKEVTKAIVSKQMTGQYGQNRW